MIKTKEKQYFIDWGIGKITHEGNQIEKFKEENNRLKVAIVGSRSIIYVHLGQTNQSHIWWS